MPLLKLRYTELYQLRVASRVAKVEVDEAVLLVGGRALVVALGDGAGVDTVDGVAREHDGKRLLVHREVARRVECFGPELVLPEGRGLVPNRRPVVSAAGRQTSIKEFDIILSIKKMSLSP